MSIGNVAWFRDLILNHTLPQGWFNGGEVITAVANAIAEPSAFAFDQLVYVQRQARLATASDGFLDLLAEDWFGRGQMKRRKGESDDAYRDRLQAEVLRPLATRPAMANAVTDLTGKAPTIFEPGRQPDCGAWGGTSGPYVMGYGSAGRLGSLDRPFQFFVDVTRPDGQGIPDCGGFYVANSAAIGGYGTGAIQYASSDDLAGDVTDADIMATISRTTPAGCTAWVAIKSGD